jgi:hypothetical protein
MILEPKHKNHLKDQYKINEQVKKNVISGGTLKLLSGNSKLVTQSL